MGKFFLMGMDRIWLKKILMDMDMDMKIPLSVPYPIH
jgi:hypothetical protein